MSDFDEDINEYDTEQAPQIADICDSDNDEKDAPGLNTSESVNENVYGHFACNQIRPQQLFIKQQNSTSNMLNNYR